VYDRILRRSGVFNAPVRLTRTATLVGVLALLGPAAGAEAKIIEIGETPEAAAATPSCPRTCNAVSRTTGYQAKVGEKRGLFLVPQDGRIVAWTITLAKPGPSQIKFFEENLGGAASAGISILRPGKRLFSRTLRSSPVVPLTPYFGKTVQFALTRSLLVHKGELVGLNVPTWAPALAVGLGGDTSWRASRAADRCRDTQTQTAQQPGQVTQYLCLYRTARLLYSATLVTSPGT
jgi:hypothetical protein